VTIGPSPRHRGETASTISFGQRAMKVENMLKLKEEFDYKSLCRRYEMQIDKLIADNERNAKDFQNAEEERDRMVREAQDHAIEAQNKLSSALERMDAERSSYQNKCRLSILLNISQNLSLLPWWYVHNGMVE
jgi:kinesin family protein 5